MVGIKPRLTQQQFLSNMHSPELIDILQTFPSEPGDAYYISSGRVHALEPGNLVLSVEQAATPPLTITNWDPANQPTKEECQKAVDAVHFQDRSIARIRCESSSVTRNRKLPIINLCPAFTVDELRLSTPMHERTDGSSFHFVTTINGRVEIKVGKHAEVLERGDSCLVPAKPGYYAITPEDPLTKVVKAAIRA